MKNKIVLSMIIAMMIPMPVFAGSMDIGDLSGEMDMDTSSLSGSMPSGSLDTSSFGNSGLNTSSLGSQSLDTSSFGNMQASDFSKSTSSDMSNLASSFGEMSAQLNEKLGEDMNIDMGSLQNLMGSIEMPEMPKLKEYDLDSISADMAKSMKLKATDTLKSYTGLNFTDLGSSLYAVEKMPEVNYETVNLKYADLIAGLREDGYGQDVQPVQPQLASGYATDVQSQFKSAFGDMPSGVQDKEMPAIDTSKLVNDKLNTRGKAIAESKLGSSAVYKKASEKINLSQGVAKVKSDLKTANAKAKQKSNAKTTKKSSKKKSSKKKKK